MSAADPGFEGATCCQSRVCPLRRPGLPAQSPPSAADLAASKAPDVARDAAPELMEVTAVARAVRATLPLTRARTKLVLPTRTSDED